MTKTALPGLLATGALVAVSACASSGSNAVSRAEIPTLEARVAERPSDGVATLRLAAALSAMGECERAIPVARRGVELRPQDALGVLVVGACLEQAGNLDEALAEYDAFTAGYGSSLGAPAVAARALLARRETAARSAREMMTDEARLSTAAADPDVLAVMPVEIVGDSAYAPLSLGLSAMLTSDLSLLRGLRLVERTHLSGLLRELGLATSGRVDPATAARAGRLLRAGTMVHGFTLIAPDEQLRLEASLMDSDRRIAGTETNVGPLRELLRLEKELVLGLIQRMGYPLSEAERRAIMENGTQSLAAFLAYSRGLLEEDLGNYTAAERHFRTAVRADPSFLAAREAHRANAGVSIVQGNGPAGAPGQARATVADPVMPTADESMTSALSSGVQDVSPTLAEALTGVAAGAAASTSTASPPPSVTGILAQIATFGFRYRLVFP